MTKYIFIGAFTLLLFIIGAWYLGNEQQSASFGDTDLSDVTFVSCTNGGVPSRYREGTITQWTVQYPSNWENKMSCNYFLSPDDRGRVKDFIKISAFEIYPDDATVNAGYKSSQEANLKRINANIKADNFTVDGIPAYQNPGNKHTSRSVDFIAHNYIFNIRKGEATSDAIFDKFVDSFQFVNQPLE